MIQKSVKLEKIIPNFVKISVILKLLVSEPFTARIIVALIEKHCDLIR